MSRVSCELMSVFSSNTSLLWNTAVAERSMGYTAGLAERSRCVASRDIIHAHSRGEVCGLNLMPAAPNTAWRGY